MAMPVAAPVQRAAFDLAQTLVNALQMGGETLLDGDVLAVSSKYAAIAEGRVVTLDELVISPEAAALAEQYQMNQRIAQLVVQ